MFAEGFCKHADRCHFAHGEQMLRTRQQNAEEFNLPNPFQAMRARTIVDIGRGISQQNEPSAAMTAPKSDLPDKQGGRYQYFVVRTPDPAEKMANRL